MTSFGSRAAPYTRRLWPVVQLDDTPDRHLSNYDAKPHLEVNLGFIRAVPRPPHNLTEWWLNVGNTTWQYLVEFGKYPRTDLKSFGKFSMRFAEYSSIKIES